MIPLWTVVERFVAGVGVSPNRTGLMAFAFGRVSDTWDVPVFSAATRNTTTQHLFQVKTSILGGKNTDTYKKNLNRLNNLKYVLQKNEVSQ